MNEFKLVPVIAIPLSAKVTPGALMPKVFCVLENGGGTVFLGRNKVKKFRKQENALKKTGKVYSREIAKVMRFWAILNKKGPLLIRNGGKAIVRNKSPEEYNFENVM